MARIGQFAHANPKTTFVLLVVLVTLMCMIISALIVTDREKINAVIKDCMVGLEDNKVDAVLAHVAQNYTQEDMDRADLRGYIETGLAEFGPPSITILSRDFTIREGKTDCRLVLFSTFPQSAQWHGVTIKSIWVVRMKKVSKEWFITEVTPVEVAGHHREGGLRGLRKDYEP
jgi:hypothetical protein